MNGHIIFALLLLAFSIIGVWVCVFLEYGGLDEITNKLLKFIYSKIDDEKKDI